MGGSACRIYRWQNQCGRRDRFVVPAAGFTTNDDRSMHEMSPINATVTKQLVINLCITAAYRFMLVISSISMQKRVILQNRVLKIGAGLAVKHKTDNKSLPIPAFANSTKRNILLSTESVVFYVMLMFFDLLLLFHFCNRRIKTPL